MVHLQLALAVAAQRLSNAYGGGSLNNRVNAEQDISYRQILLQAESADAFIGGDSTTTSTNYGAKVDSAENLPTVLDGAPGGIKISDIWVAGNGATIHVFGIPL